MKIVFPMYSCAGSRPGQRGFTVAEMVIAVGVFMLLMGGIIYGYIFGLNLFQVTKMKLGASDDARKAFILLTDEIRSANKVKIGGGSLAGFVEKTNGTQVGTAVRIFPTTNVNSWIQYWYETNSTNASFTKLLRTTDGTNFIRVMPDGITNNVPIFTAEDSAGNYLTNNLNNHVIGVTLQFYQLEYPQVRIGSGYYYDFYQLHTRITRRTLY